jgi:diaminopimelate decarboxylase
VLHPATAAGTPCAAVRPVESLPAPVRTALTDAVDRGSPVSGYFYDCDRAARQACALRAALPAWASLLFAVKANSYRPVLAAMAGPGGIDGFEVASVAEARLAAGVRESSGRPGRLVAAGPGKHPGLLGGLLDAGTDVVHVESRLELMRLSHIAARRGATVPVALRVNPTTVTLAGTLAMGGRGSAFGIPEPDVPAAVDLARSLPALDLVGFHVHAVCGNRDAAAHAGYVRECLAWAAATARRHRVDLRWLDVGGGLGVDYDGSGALDVEVLGDELDRLRPPAGVEIAFEPGRFLVADCGWYAAEVVDVKESYGETYLVVRGGIGGFTLPGTEDFPFPLVVVPVDRWEAHLPRPEARRTRVTVAGELCTPEDVLVRDVHVDRVRAGDLVVVPKAGAYGWEFALQAFLAHPPATRSTVPVTDTTTTTDSHTRTPLPDLTLEASR